MAKTLRDLFPEIEEQWLRTTIREVEEKGYTVLIADKQTEKIASAIVSDLDLAPGLEPIALVVVRTFLNGLRTIVDTNNMLKAVLEDGEEQFKPLLTPCDKSTDKES
jgi:hypothetical protein